MGGESGSRAADQVIRELASLQGGVVARPQLLRRGITSRQIDRRLDGGRLRAIHRGVYAVGHDALGERGRLIAALLLGGATAVLSHGTAAAIWKLIASMPQLVEVTTTTKAPKQRPGIRFYTTSHLDTRTRDGLRLTTPIRTLLDLAATRPADALERACGEALYLRLVHPEQLRQQTGRGAARLRAVAAEAAPTRNDFERRMLRLIRKHRLPAAQVNVRLGRYRPDFLWPRHRVVVETDGWQGHGHRLAFESDRARDAALQAAGYAVLRFTWRQIKDDPDLVAERIGEALRRRAA